MKKLALIITLLAAHVVAQSVPIGTPVPIGFFWDNPGTQYTNITYVLHYTTNSTLAYTNWPSKTLTNVQVYTASRLTSTNSFPYADQWYFTLSASNTFWHLDSVFSNVASPGNQMPPTNNQYLLFLLPTP